MRWPDIKVLWVLVLIVGRGGGSEHFVDPWFEYHAINGPTRPPAHKVGFEHCAVLCCLEDQCCFWSYWRGSSLDYWMQVTTEGKLEYEGSAGEQKACEAVIETGEEGNVTSMAARQRDKCVQCVHLLSPVPAPDVETSVTREVVEILLTFCVVVVSAVIVSLCCYR